MKVETYFVLTPQERIRMAVIKDRTWVPDGIDPRYVLLGVVLAIASVAVASWSLISNEISTSLFLLLYVIVGVLLIGIGTSPRPNSDTE
jgi:hypothetical protein